MDMRRFAAPVVCSFLFNGVVWLIWGELSLAEGCQRLVWEMGHSHGFLIGQSAVKWFIGFYFGSVFSNEMHCWAWGCSPQVTETQIISVQKYVQTVTHSLRQNTLIGGLLKPHLLWLYNANQSSDLISYRVHHLLCLHLQLPVLTISHRQSLIGDSSIVKTDILVHCALAASICRLPFSQYAPCTMSD